MKMSGETTTTNPVTGDGADTADPVILEEALSEAERNRVVLEATRKRQRELLAEFNSEFEAVENWVYENPSWDSWEAERVADVIRQVGRGADVPLTRYASKRQTRAAVKRLRDRGVPMMIAASGSTLWFWVNLDAVEARACEDPERVWELLAKEDASRGYRQANNHRYIYGNYHCILEAGISNPKMTTEVLVRIYHDLMVLRDVPRVAQPVREALLARGEVGDLAARMAVELMEGGALKKTTFENAYQTIMAVVSVEES